MVAVVNYTASLYSTFINSNCDVCLPVALQKSMVMSVKSVD
jgi:hypothetical protein